MRIASVATLALAALATLTPVSCVHYQWTDWFSSDISQATYFATGKITTTTQTIAVSLVADSTGIHTDIGGETDFWTTTGGIDAYTSPEVDNRPTGSDMIRVSSGGRKTLTFSQPITDPVFAFVSTNGNVMKFNHEIQVLSLAGHTKAGWGTWGRGHFGIGDVSITGPDGNGEWSMISLSPDQNPYGNEPHGTIRIKGTISSITFTDTAEHWHGFTIGIAGAASETNLGPAANTVKCSSYGDPHIKSFANHNFDCHADGEVTYYQSGLVSVVSQHIPLTSNPAIKLNGDITITAGTIGVFVARASDGHLLWTPTAGATIDLHSGGPVGINVWLSVATGASFIRQSSKYGVYIASAQLTVYVSWALFQSNYWNLDVVVPLHVGDSGICVENTCPAGPTTPPAPECELPLLSIETACAAALGITLPSIDAVYLNCIFDTITACDLRIPPTYIPRPAPPAPLTPPDSGATGDPQFVGLQGQSYQVHGADDTVFALISTPSMVMNGLFTYLGVGGSCNYNNTACWSHPGTYISQLGFRVRHHDNTESQIALISGPHARGCRVTINNKPMAQGTVKLGSTNIAFNGHDQVRIHIHDLFIVEVVNSDLFFNMGVQLLRHDWLQSGHKRVKLTSASAASALSVYPSVPLHGLLGITWRNVVYPTGRVYEGDVMDYAMDNHDLFDIDFTYNQYTMDQE